MLHFMIYIRHLIIIQYIYIYIHTNYIEWHLHFWPEVNDNTVLSHCINCEIGGGIMRSIRSWRGGGWRRSTFWMKLLIYHHQYFRCVSRNFWGGGELHFLAFCNEMFTKNVSQLFLRGGGGGAISKIDWLIDWGL